jgi:hypothetical protein
MSLVNLPIDCWVKAPHGETRRNVKGTAIEFSETTGNYLVVYPTLTGKVQAFYSEDEISFEEPECEDIKG